MTLMRLAVCQATGQTANPIILTTAALIGSQLASDPRLATLPVAVAWIGTMLTTVPASLLMQKIGRKAGFTTGTLCGFGGGLLGAYAILQASFPLFLLAMILHGTFVAFTNYYRFAACEMVPDAQRGRAIGVVLTGGVVAAVLGPTIAAYTDEWLAPILFAGCYLAVAGIAVVNALALQTVRFAPMVPVDGPRAAGRPLHVILRQPRAIAAIAAAAIGYGVMSLVMTVTPLAMRFCGHSFDDAAFVISWHAIAMFAPSFVTGKLVERVGCLPIIFAGLVANLLCIAVNLTGIGVWHFWASLVLLGLGWNLLFVGGTALLTTTYRPEERARVQAANEFVVFGTVTVAALGSGVIQASLGWAVVNLAMLLPLALAFLAALRVVTVRPVAPA